MYNSEHYDGEETLRFNDERSFVIEPLLHAISLSQSPADLSIFNQQETTSRILDRQSISKTKRLNSLGG